MDLWSHRFSQNTNEWRISALCSNGRNLDNILGENKDLLSVRYNVSWIRYQGSGIRDQGSRIREQGTVNREQGTVNSEQGETAVNCCQLTSLACLLLVRPVQVGFFWGEKSQTTQKSQSSSCRRFVPDLAQSSSSRRFVPDLTQSSSSRRNLSSPEPLPQTIRAMKWP